MEFLDEIPSNNYNENNYLVECYSQILNGWLVSIEVVWNTYRVVSFFWLGHWLVWPSCVNLTDPPGLNPIPEVLNRFWRLKVNSNRTCHQKSYYQLPKFQRLKVFYKVWPIKKLLLFSTSNSIWLWKLTQSFHQISQS